MEYLEEALEELLLHKSYPQLSLAERSYVAAFLSEEEYSQYHAVLAKSGPVLRAEYAGIIPDPAIAGHLKNAFKTNYANRFAWPLSIRSFQFRLPVLPTGFALATILVLVYFFGPDLGKEPENLAPRETAYIIAKESVQPNPTTPAVALVPPQNNEKPLIKAIPTKRKLQNTSTPKEQKPVPGLTVAAANLKEIEDYLLQVNEVANPEPADEVSSYLSTMPLPQFEPNSEEIILNQEVKTSY